MQPGMEKETDKQAHINTTKEQKLVISKNLVLSKMSIETFDPWNLVLSKISTLRKHPWDQISHNFLHAFRLQD